MNRKFSYLVLWILIIAFLEFCGYVFLKGVTLDYQVDFSKETGLKIRSYLINPISSPEQPKFLPQTTTGYIHNPDYQKGDQRQNNEFGWRGKAPKVFKEKDVYRIVCLGGSTTYGSGVDNPNSTYPVLLQKQLAVKYPEKKFEVINAGIEGLTSFHEITSYLFKIRYLQPDAVILKSGGNDADQNLMSGKGYSPDLHFSDLYFHNLPLVNKTVRLLMYSHFFSAINIYINQYGVYGEDDGFRDVFLRKLPHNHTWFDKDLSFVLENMEYYSFKNNFETLIDLIDRDGITVYAMPFALNPNGQYYKRMNMDDYLKLNALNNKLMQDAISSRGLIWIPFTSDSIPTKAWIGDHCHLNESGIQEKAAFVSRYILLPEN